MLTFKDEETIIRFINDGMALDLIAFALNMPEEEVNKYKEELDFRKKVSGLIQKGDYLRAKDELLDHKDDIVSSTILLEIKRRLGETIDLDQSKLEEQKELLDINKTSGDILQEIGIKFPKKKANNNKRKKQSKLSTKVDTHQIKVRESETENEEVISEQPSIEVKDEIYYQRIIDKTKQEIEANPRNFNKRNFLAHTYFQAGRVDEAKEELQEIIKEIKSAIAYQQMAHIEEETGEIENAKIWLYEGNEQHPDNANILKQLINLDRRTGELEEAIEYAQQLVKKDPKNTSNLQLLKSLERQQRQTIGGEEDQR